MPISLSFSNKTRSCCWDRSELPVKLAVMVLSHVVSVIADIIGIFINKGVMWGWPHEAIGLEDSGVAQVLGGGCEFTSFVILHAFVQADLVQGEAVLFLERIIFKEHRFELLCI